MLKETETPRDNRGGATVRLYISLSPGRKLQAHSSSTRHITCTTVLSQGEGTKVLLIEAISDRVPTASDTWPALISTTARGGAGRLSLMRQKEQSAPRVEGF